MNQIRTIKGTHDVLPEKSKDWQRLEKIIHKNVQLIHNTQSFSSCMFHF